MMRSAILLLAGAALAWPASLPAQPKHAKPPATPDFEGAGASLAEFDSAAPPRSVPGTRISLVPPTGFVPAERFAGFQHPVEASIMVMEMPGGYDATTFTAEALASRGMRLRGSEAVTVAGRRGLLLSVSQAAHGITFEKWILTLGDDSTTVMITAAYPAALDPLREPLRRSVLSARWDPERRPDPLEGLGFRITPPTGLKLATRMGTTLLFTESGQTGTDRPREAIFIVTPSVAPSDLRDLEAFSRRAVQGIATVTRVSVRSGSEMEVGGARAYELVAAAETSGVPVVIYQVVIPEGNQYMRVVGMVAADRADLFLPRFRQAALSLRRSP